MTLVLTADINVDEELPIEPSKAAQYLLYAIAGLLFFAFLWASIAKLDRVTRGDGKFVPSNHLQQVQYLEGGIIEEILVKPGEDVKKGQILVKLDPTQINAQFTQGRGGYHMLAARIARLEAAAAERAIVFPADLQRAAPDVVANERKLFEARRQEYEAALAVEAGKLAEAEAALAYASETHELAAQELAIVEPLVNKGIEPKLELIRARQRAAGALGEKQRAEIAVKNALSETDRIKSTYFASIADELGKARAEMTGVSGELPALRDKVDRTEVRSPIDGVVHRVLVATIGGVVQPGQTIVEVVPHGDTPLVEAKIKPADIGFLRVGQEARIKVSAYDSSTYGSMKGTIETISPDAIEDEKDGQRHFLITVRLEDAALKTKDGALPLMPGMAAEVDVLNGKRTVLAYMLKPIAEVSNKALRED
ncbi:MAG TPA: HlyD family type I secretion periplasmic adaptor subunit [Parvularculaceae bacterium]|nr:HlyD family type I secretion periplasmic adaptor subunit [Parvularculaceae bacterium]HNS87696.1 HlyD family type I secretion periplasmic adaptor subunit [Parvularculaceae bacterium]